MFESLISRFGMTLRCSLVLLGIVSSCFYPAGCATPAARSGRPSRSPRLIIHNVKLRSMTEPQARGPQTVIIEGERITRIVDAADASPSPGDQIIDATDRFLMPGLADMHSHAETSQEMAKGNVAGLAVALPELDVVPVEQGGRCKENCNGSHQARVELGECWRQYAFRFDELEPPSWSPERGPLNPAELTGVQFIVYTNTAPDNQFDYWLDELEFFRGERPQGTRACEADAGEDGS